MTYTCRISLNVAPFEHQNTKAPETPLLLSQLAEFFCDGAEHTIEPVADTPTSPLLTFHSGIVRSPPKTAEQLRTVSEWTQSINAVHVNEQSRKQDSGNNKPAPQSETLEQFVTARSALAHNSGLSATAGAKGAQQPQYVLLDGCSWSSDDECGSPQWHPFSSPAVLPLSVPQF